MKGTHFKSLGHETTKQPSAKNVEKISIRLHVFATSSRDPNGGHKEQRKDRGVAKHKDGGSIDTATRCSESGKLIKFIPVPYDYSNSTQLSDNFCNSIGILQNTGNAEQSGGSDQKKTGQEGTILCMC